MPEWLRGPPRKRLGLPAQVRILLLSICFFFSIVANKAALCVSVGAYFFFFFVVAVIAFLRIDG